MKQYDIIVGLPTGKNEWIGITYAYDHEEALNMGTTMAHNMFGNDWLNVSAIEQ